jgi:hypothetical protein
MEENNKIPLDLRDRVTDVDHLGVDFQSGADYVIFARGLIRG